MSRLAQLIHEIHRRSLWQVVGIYLAASWVALQVVETLGDTVGLPGWFGPVAFGLLVVGFPIVIGTAFVQEGVPHGGTGIRPESSLPDPEGGSSVPTRDGASREAEPPAATVATMTATRAQASAARRWLTWRRAILGGAAAFTLLGLFTAIYLIMRASGIGPAGTLVAQGLLEERAAILISDFASDDPALARTATEAFRIDLSQSPTVRLVEPSFVSGALRRMGLEADAAIDVATGRELAQREGIPAVLAGEINRAGGGFLLTASLVDAEGGSMLLSHREMASDSAGILPAIDRLSKRLRERIGEPLRSIRRAEPLARVTTPSLEALRRYSQALHALDVQGDSDRGLALLEEAVAIDTTFAMAYRKLGIELSNRAIQHARSFEAIRRAYEHRDRLSERERYLAAGTYHAHVGDLPAAIQAYESMLELDPRDDWALNNLSVLYASLRNYARAEDYSRRAVESDPDSWLALVNLATVRIDQGKGEEARSAVALLQERFPGNGLVEFYTAQLESSLGEHARSEERLRAMLAEQLPNPVLRSNVLDGLAGIAAARGRTGEALSLYEELRGGYAERGLATDYVGATTRIAFLHGIVLGDPEAGYVVLEEALERFPLAAMTPLSRPYLELAAAYAWLGRPERAGPLLEAYEALDPVLRRSSREGDAGWHRTRGAVSLAEGRLDDAIAAYRKSDTDRCALCPLPGVARAYDRAGAVDSALAAYERYVTHPMIFRLGMPGTLIAGPYGDRYFLGPSLERLAQLYDERGDPERAAEHYARFVDLWEDADPHLLPRVEAARSRLAEIAAERG